MSELSKHFTAVSPKVPPTTIETLSLIKHRSFHTVNCKIKADLLIIVDSQPLSDFINAYVLYILFPEELTSLILTACPAARSAI